jgi:hypothetical protein
MSIFYDDDEPEPVRKKKQIISINMPVELIVAIDRRRGEHIPRSAWVVNDLYKIYDIDIKRIRREQLG